MKRPQVLSDVIVLSLERFHTELKVQPSGDKVRIWDVIRRKYVMATPEELVRQLFVMYLIQELKYSKTSISIEKSFTINGLTKRYDIVVYHKDKSPLILVECKAPEVNITQNSFDQALRYNTALSAPYLIVTNGRTAFCAGKTDEKSGYYLLNKVPDANSITGK
ncbi:MAG: type I restriction enzyme HsdR N-terminal domain-containing protein [Saprospiraceae bacterium]|nr:type I restriction enzyme HsdR N-terminal domain-containing protein [Saprospiraceae bacterium]